MEAGIAGMDRLHCDNVIHCRLSRLRSSYGEGHRGLWIDELQGARSQNDAGSLIKIQSELYCLARQSLFESLSLQTTTVFCWKGVRYP
jgi:hypothetical protein